MPHFFSHGKFLLSGEYLVLAGAKALALPLKKGQKSSIEVINSDNINWKSVYNNEIWFQAQFAIKNLEITETTDELRASYIQNLLRQIKLLRPKIFQQGYSLEHRLDFHPSWGMGSSSTLINNLASWADIDAYELLSLVSKGSGYDIACAKASKPLFFQKTSKGNVVEPASFSPEFHSQIKFVYLGKKQDSEKGILPFINELSKYRTEIEEISTISEAIPAAKNTKEFVYLIENHEKIIASVIQRQPVKEEKFNDYWGSIKSLGAWGGDFVLTISEENPEKDIAYFQQKGYKTLFNFKELLP